MSGELLASGRDCDIYDAGTGRVLRKAKDGRSLAAEAAVMQHAADAGYPVPAVYDVVDGSIVMERVDGPTMVHALARSPWRAGAMGRELAALHAQLHRIPAPPGAARMTETGDRLLHLDLHPANVLLSSRGLVVIDWANARAGEPGFDVALAWTILATADVPAPLPIRAVAGVVRRRFLRAFLDAAGREEAAVHLAAAGAYWAGNRNVRPHEAERVERLVRSAARPRRDRPTGGSPADDAGRTLSP